MPKTRDCKLCGQPLADANAIAHVRAHGRGARRLTGPARELLRKALKKRESRRRRGWKADTIQQLAHEFSCSPRTVIREREWMLIEGVMEDVNER